MIMKMFKELGRRLDEHCEKLEVFNKELKNIKRTRIKNTITDHLCLHLHCCKWHYFVLSNYTSIKKF